MYFHVKGSGKMVCPKAESPKFSPHIFIAHLTSVLGTGDTTVNKTDKVLNLMEFIF